MTLERSSMDNIIENNRQAITRIVASHGGKNVRVFGSMATDSCGPDSDVDLLIRLDPNRSLLDLIAIKQDIEDLLKRAAHVLTERSLSPYIRSRVLQEAVSI